MKHFITISLVIGLVLLSSCDKEKFEKKTLFYEGFDNNAKGWYSVPDTNILHSSSECIKIEDGLLKMHFERGLGISNCGGGWLAMELNDPTLNREEYSGQIGIKIVLNQGFFQQINFIDSVVGNSTYGHLLQYSRFDIQCGRHMVNFPTSKSLHNIDLDVNKFNGREFIFLSHTNYQNNQVYIDKQLIHYSGNMNWYSIFGNTFDFQMTFKIGYATELMPHEINLFIESIEIFTWEGEFDIDKL